MKRTASLLVAALTTFAGLNAARASEYPILDSYQALAESLYESAETASTPEEIAELETGTRELIAQGVETMKLVASKVPACVAQFDVMIPEVPAMESMTVEAAHERYHDGKGLPAAPRQCYLGRSQVIHPMLNLIRIKSGWTGENRLDVLDELDEVIEHVAKIRTLLANPPQ